jgi:N-methylhydantoinase B
VRDYRITADEAWFTGTFGRFKYLPWGMAGGQEGSRNYTQILFSDGRQPDVFGKTAQCHLVKDDVARLVTRTGGGYGDRLRRPVEMVRSDVKNGYITLEQAKRDYGVVLNPETLEVERLVGGRQE